MMVGEMEVKERPRPSPDYLMQLLNEKKLMSSLPNLCGIFTHLERLLDEEINRVRKDMYNDTVSGLVDKHPLELPEPHGPIVHLQEKLFVPVKEYPDVSNAAHHTHTTNISFIPRPFSRPCAVIGCYSEITGDVVSPEQHVVMRVLRPQ
ncbi:hypothetical protein AOLI_G00126890 [Acnodon oligacanthus]